MLDDKLTPYDIVNTLNLIRNMNKLSVVDMLKYQLVIHDNFKRVVKLDFT